jgi:hypothetical protein
LVLNLWLGGGFSFFLFGRTQGLALAKQMLYRLSHTLVHSALVVLEIGACELFAQAVLEPQSSWSFLLSSWDYRRQPQGLALWLPGWGICFVPLLCPNEPQSKENPGCCLRAGLAHSYGKLGFLPGLTAVLNSRNPLLQTCAIQHGHHGREWPLSPGNGAGPVGLCCWWERQTGFQRPNLLIYFRNLAGENVVKYVMMSF